MAPTLEDFVSDAAVKLLLSELRVDGRLASGHLAEGVAEEVEDDQRQLAELNDMWTANELSTAE